MTGPQVGAGLGVSLRYVRQFTDKTAGRVVAKAGLAGLELELGATQRISEFCTAGMGVSVGTQVSHSLTQFAASTREQLLWPASPAFMTDVKPYHPQIGSTAGMGVSVGTQVPIATRLVE